MSCVAGEASNILSQMKTAVVCGAGGFIGSHLVKRLKREGYWVRGVDIKNPEFSATAADDFRLLDLRKEENCQAALALPDLDRFDSSLAPSA